VVKRLFLAMFCQAAFCLAAVLPVFSQSFDTQGTGIRVMVRTDGLDDVAMAVSLAGALARSTKLDAILIAPVGVDLLWRAFRLEHPRSTFRQDACRGYGGRTVSDGTRPG